MVRLVDDFALGSPCQVVQADLVAHQEHDAMDDHLDSRSPSAPMAESELVDSIMVMRLQPLPLPLVDAF